MDPDCQSMSAHMKWLGLGILAQAQKNAFYYDFPDTIDRNIFSVLQAAHASEIFIKAAISQEHPLLIFSQIPKSTTIEDDLLSFKDLLNKGKTIQYSDLPERLWATTGYKLQEIEIYQQFGKLRNTIQHLALPQEKVELGKQTANFIYKVIDPLIGNFWNLYAIDYCDVEEHEYDVLPLLINFGITDFRYPNRLTTQVTEVLSEIEKEATK